MHKWLTRHIHAGALCACASSLWRSPVRTRQGAALYLLRDACVCCAARGKTMRGSTIWPLSETNAEAARTWRVEVEVEVGGESRDSAPLRCSLWELAVNVSEPRDGGDEQLVGRIETLVDASESAKELLLRNYANDCIYAISYHVITESLRQRPRATAYRARTSRGPRAYHTAPPSTPGVPAEAAAVSGIALA